jgi:hypothetical protein
MPLAELVFLTPLAGLFAVAVGVPLLAFADLLRRESRVRDVLAMPAPGRRGRIAAASALSFVPALIALAATQPVLELGEKKPQREDAEAYVVFDTSRSMLAASGPDEPWRLQRAEALARELRLKLPTVPVGIASFTDRVLPHLFPSIERNAFAATVSRSIGIELPPPSSFYDARATQLSALASLATRNFFSPTAEHRLAIVFTDGESGPAGQRVGEAFRARGVRAIFVHVWDEDERVFGTGDAPEPEYRPDPESAATLRQLASAVRGRVFEEDQLDEVADAAETMLGRGGKTIARSPEQIALAPWITLTAFLPLGLILLRRNF